MNFTRRPVNTSQRTPQFVIIPGIGQQRPVETQPNPAPQLLAPRPVTEPTRPNTCNQFHHVTSRPSSLAGPSSMIHLIRRATTRPLHLPLPLAPSPWPPFLYTHQPSAGSADIPVPFSSCLRCLFLFFFLALQPSRHSQSSGSSTRRFFHLSPPPDQVNRNRPYQKKSHRPHPLRTSSSLILNSRFFVVDHAFPFLCHDLKNNNDTPRFQTKRAPELNPGSERSQPEQNGTSAPPCLLLLADLPVRTARVMSEGAKNKVPHIVHISTIRCTLIRPTRDTGKKKKKTLRIATIVITHNLNLLWLKRVQYHTTD